MSSRGQRGALTRGAKDAGTLLGPVAVAGVALACRVGLPSLAATVPGLTLAAILGVGGGLLMLLALASAAALILRARRRRCCVRSGDRQS
jgi:hypothetical protein